MPTTPFRDTVAKVASFSLYAGVAAKPREGETLERLYRYISALSPQIVLCKYYSHRLEMLLPFLY